MSAEPCAVTSDLSQHEAKQDKFDARQEVIDKRKAELIDIFEEDARELYDDMTSWNRNRLTDCLLDNVGACRAGLISKEELGEEIIRFFEEEGRSIAEVKAVIETNE